MKTNLIGISGKIGSGKDATGIIIDMISEGFSVKSIVSFVERGQFNGYNFQRKKYADKLKGGCEYDFPNEFSVKEWETGDRSYRDEIMPSLGISRRDFLLKRGDNCRAIHSDYFVNALFADFEDKIKKLPEDYKENWFQNRGENRLQLKNNAPKIYQEYNKMFFEHTRDSYLPNWIITDVRFPNEAKAIKDRGGVVIRVNRTRTVMVKGVKYFMGHDGLPEHASETALDDYEFDAVIDNNGSIEELVEKVKQLKLV